MIRYFAAAAVLKFFSCSAQTRRMYRALGNSLGGLRRAKLQMPKLYFARVNRFLQLNRRIEIFKDGGRVLELGTGWLHWEAIIARLFFDVQCTLFDVWDNRQMKGLKNYVSQLGERVEKLDADALQRERAAGLIRKILKAKNFEDLYALLDFQYVVDPSGDLTKLETDGFDVVVSHGVLEHINSSILPKFVTKIGGLLKPGGYSVHHVNLRDHLYLYDKTVSTKQYLAYSDKTWTRWFQNQVQYINRVQCSQWHNLFKNAGLKLIEGRSSRENLSGLNIAEQYREYDRSDLECGSVTLIHQKE